MIDSDFTRRPVTPPEETRRKSTVLADLNQPTSVRSTKPMSGTTPTSHTTTTTTDTTTPSMQDPIATTTSSGSGSSERTEVTQRIERQIYQLLQWENPIRSGVTLGVILLSLVLSRSYSLLQIGAALLTIGIGLNLIYVTFVVQTQKVFSDSKEPVHPYSGVIGRKEDFTSIDKRTVHHYSSLAVDIAETVIRALARIVFIEDSMTSLKWLVIFYLTWTVSAHVSSRTIIGFFVVSAFVFPRLYMSNKGIIDSHIQHGEAVIKQQLSTAQTFVEDNVTDASAKMKAYFAKAGTSGTDAKNSIQNTSATMKKTE
ncbi:hypothetical protein RO3G_15560 [Lichtheimia corymbifera JMRC:FSU:9682]|uniref:Reticulon-like protein n=1 Tax=Lichtheimia corymbifera JMRC:FSU:9682 TaxID=1263082 RepID=A0A068RIG3_9FUNG|nr:hypothetical protein RO3G_15560 [Lichtheimia corymbifera JMRC:FSU:9682]